MDYPPEGTTAHFGTHDDLGFALKIIIYILVGAVFFLASFVAYLYVFFLPQQPEMSAHEFTDAEFATVYAEPIPTFNLSGGSVAVTDVTEGTLGIGIEDDVIYTFGYISNDGMRWRRVALQPGRDAIVDKDEMWITKNATYEHLIGSADFNITAYPCTAVGYVALYSCSRGPIGQWDCHGGWQIQQFTTIIVKDDTPKKDPCGGCNAGFACVQNRCVREENVRNAARVGADESLSVTVDGKEYLLTVTSIGGQGIRAGISLNGQAFTADESTGDIYFVKDDFRFIINRIEPFTSDTDGFLEIVVVGNYDDMHVCENCVYRPQTTGIISGGGGSSSRGSKVSTCTPDCSAKQCGSNGCGGTCGTCGTGFVCTNYQCIKEQCIHDCSNESSMCADQTWSDGCGGTCTGLIQPDCMNPATEQPYECGRSPNNCGWCNTTDNYCKLTYGQQYVCSNNMCGLSCTQDCTGKECGDDGCEGSCGTCEEGYECGVDGQCACVPDCECTSSTCIGQTCSNGCEGTCDGILGPDCGARVCGTSPNGCGSCGTCSLANAISTCNASYQCAVSSCNSGYANCDVATANGCETQLGTMSNCASCGDACTSGYTCTSYVCTPPAPTCSDGIQNGDETGIDCGGSCPACQTGPIYYVSTSGDNSNNGTQTYSAWRTLQYAESYATTPGSIIALKRGDTFSVAYLKINHGGNPTNYITWDGSLWGSGNNAIIKKGTSNDYGFVNIYGCQYVIFQNITVDVDNKKSYGGITIGGYNGCTPGSIQNDERYIIIQDCTVQKVGSVSDGNWCVGIHVNAIHNDIYNITIQRNTVTETNNHGIAFYNCRIGVPAECTGTHTTHDSYCGYNTISKAGMLENNVAGGIMVTQSIDGIVVEHNTVSGGGAGLANGISTGNGIGLDVGALVKNAVIRYNDLKPSGGGITFENGGAMTTEVYYNKIEVGNGHHGLYIQPGTFTDAEIYMYNNDIIISDLGSVALRDESTSITTCIFKNNLMYSEEVGNWWDGSLMVFEYDNIIHSNNLNYRADAQNCALAKINHPEKYYARIAGSQRSDYISTFESTGVITDPELHDVWNDDWHLQSSSPAINNGTGVGLTQDFDGNPIVGAPDIGAYEYH